MDDLYEQQMELERLLKTKSPTIGITAKPTTYLSEKISQIKDMKQPKAVLYDFFHSLFAEKKLFH